jgi:hypothetical protein
MSSVRTAGRRYRCSAGRTVSRRRRATAPDRDGSRSWRRLP